MSEIWYCINLWNGLSGKSDTQHINANAAQSAANAKTLTLPVLQANQDPFGSLSRLERARTKPLETCFSLSNTFSQAYYLPSLMALPKRSAKRRSNRRLKNWIWDPLKWCDCRFLLHMNALKNKVKATVRTVWKQCLGMKGRKGRASCITTTHIYHFYLSGFNHPLSWYQNYLGLPQDGGWHQGQSCRVRQVVHWFVDATTKCLCHGGPWQAHCVDMICIHIPFSSIL